MTIDIRWTTRLLNQPWEVCGFRRAKLAREHADKHFLNVREQWADLRPVARPAEYDARIRAGELRHEVLDAAALDYMQVVRRYCQQSQVLESRPAYHRESGAGGFPTIVAATSGGLFCAFHDQGPSLSHLTTAFRPVPRVVRGTLITRHYVEEALRKVRRGLS